MRFVDEGEYEIGRGHVEPDNIHDMELMIEPIFFNRPRKPHAMRPTNLNGQ